ncbi:MAG: Hpt domain-containing protein, partial [Halioglobus sp.]
YQPIPIIALTAGFDKSDELRCRESGMDHYLTKPFSISEITDVLESYIGRSKSSIRGEILKGEVSIDTKSTGTSNKIEKMEDILNISAIQNILEVERQTQKPILSSVFDGFTSQMTDKLAELNSHLDLSDTEDLYKTAHAIKSMSANMGAKEVQGIAGDIERTARSGVLEGIDIRAAELGEAYIRFLAVFKQEYSN